LRIRDSGGHHLPFAQATSLLICRKHQALAIKRWTLVNSALGPKERPISKPSKRISLNRSWVLSLAVDIITFKKKTIISIFS